MKHERSRCAELLSPSSCRPRARTGQEPSLTTGCLSVFRLAQNPCRTGRSIASAQRISLPSGRKSGRCSWAHRRGGSCRTVSCLSSGFQFHQ
jgi:hypothetical protein